MSTVPAVSSSATAATVNDITNQIVAYTPAVIAGVQAAEVTGVSGASKLQAVIAGIQEGSQIAEGIPVPAVSAIAGLVNLVVSIFNAVGLFKHSTPKAPTVTTQPAATE